MLLDFCNAFNTLQRQGLLDKLAATNPPYWLVKRVHNYFTGRSQYIRARNKAPSTIPNNCGFLQGADLSQFLFTLHTSDLFLSIICFSNTQMTLVDLQGPGQFKVKGQTFGQVRGKCGS